MRRWLDREGPRPAARRRRWAERWLQKCTRLGHPSPHPARDRQNDSCHVGFRAALIGPHRKPTHHPLLSQSSPPSTLMGPLDRHGPVSARGPLACQLSSPLGRRWPEPFLRAPCHIPGATGPQAGGPHSSHPSLPSQHLALTLRT